jgi:hypothetical protein
MIKFKDRSIDQWGGVRYRVYRNGELLETYWPNNEDYKCKDGTCPGTRGDNQWARYISKVAVDFINYELTEIKKKKPLTLSEERQVYDLYFIGDTLGLREEIKKHKEEIKKLKEKLKKKLKNATSTSGSL